MSYRLPRPLTPEAGESLPGLIMRNAMELRFLDPTRLLKRRLRAPGLGLVSLCRAAPGSELGSGIRHMLGLEECQWPRMAMGTDDETLVGLNGHVVWREHMQLERRVVCPDCLAESGHHRSIWFLDALTACARHGTRLISSCPQCSLPLRWSGPGMHLCSKRRCRFDLRKAEPGRVPEGQLAGIRGLDRLFHCDDPAAEAPLGMPFGEALHVAVTLGQFALGMEKVSRLPGYIERHRGEMHLILDAGWDALSDWPNGFRRLLDRLKARAQERRGKGGLRKTFGGLSPKVFQWSREPWGAPIGTAFVEYAAEQEDLAVTAHVLGRYGSSDALRNRHMTMSEAGKALDVSAQTMRRLADRLDLYVLRPNGAGIASLLHADRIRRLKDEAAEFLLPEETRKTLNVGRKVFEKLEASGLIWRVPEEDRILEIRPFRKAAVEALVVACRGDAPELEDTEARQRGFWNLASVTAPGREPPDVCRALMEGRLKAAALVSGQPGLRGIRLDPAEVQRVLPFHRATMSAVEVGRILGVAYTHVLLLARRGLIKTTTPATMHEIGVRFSREAIADFQRDYVLGGELARQDTNGGPINGALTRHLRFLGIGMVSGPAAGDGGKLAVFRRADITPEVLASISAIRHRPAVPLRELRQRGYERVAVVGDTIGQVWGAALRRVNNRFSDDATGRVVQVVSGRRPDLTGVFRFHVQRESLKALRSAREAWVALVPNQGDMFVLLPLDQVPWRGNGSTPHVTVRCDVSGHPTELREFALPLVLPDRMAA
jgi:hypothetical protein